MLPGFEEVLRPTMPMQVKFTLDEAAGADLAAATAAWPRGER